MAQIDQTFNFQGVGIEVHIGNGPASPGVLNGVNPKGPSDAPVIPPNVVVTGSKLNTTVLSSKIVNPA